MGLHVRVRLDVDAEAVGQLKTDPEVLEYVRRAADSMAKELRNRTPRRTGAGASSIAARPAARAQGAFDAGWDKQHYYLGFPDLGTKYQAAQRFAEHVLEHYHFD